MPALQPLTAFLANAFYSPAPLRLYPGLLSLALDLLPSRSSFSSLCCSGIQALAPAGGVQVGQAGPSHGRHSPEVCKEVPQRHSQVTPKRSHKPLCIGVSFAPAPCTESGFPGATCRTKAPIPGLSPSHSKVTWALILHQSVLGFGNTVWD